MLLVQIAFGFLKKIADGAARFFTRGPRDVCDGRMVDAHADDRWLMSRSRTAGPETFRDGRWSGLRVVPGGQGEQRHLDLPPRRLAVTQVVGHLLMIS